MLGDVWINVDEDVGEWTWLVPTCLLLGCPSTTMGCSRGQLFTGSDDEIVSRLVGGTRGVKYDRLVGWLHFWLRVVCDAAVAISIC